MCQRRKKGAGGQDRSLPGDNAGRKIIPLTTSNGRKKSQKNFGFFFRENKKHIYCHQAASLRKFPVNLFMRLHASCIAASLPAKDSRI
jgi:hypothetical protein